MTSVHRMLERLLTKTLASLFSDKFKRLIFLSSFMAYIQGTSKPDKELVCKLNRLLKLANRDDTVMVPPLMNQRIWGTIVPRDEMLEGTSVKLKDLNEIQDYKIFASEARRVSDQIIHNAPPWLRYGSNKQIRADLMKLLQNVQQLKEA